MALQAIIMAGGEGSRLRPLTCDTPKPMVPVLGRPVMTYALQLLRRHSLPEIGVTLQYLPDRISRHFGAGAKDGVRLHYYREREPLGTAGGVLKAASGRHAPTDAFAILSGDGLTDCDLTEAFRFHKEKNALATLVLTRVQNPLAYGVVIADDDGRVRRFVEKPGWGEVYSDTVNTGIYILQPEILSYIWPDKPCDFGRDLFPQLVKDGKNVCAYVSDAYWCDIGDQAAYVRAQSDFLQGKIGLETGPLIAETAQIDETAVLDGPCYLGAGVKIGAGARLSDGAVLGMHVSIGAHARVAHSVLWDGATIESNANVRGAVIGRGAQVGAGATVLEDCALADSAVLGARATLEAGAKVWPGKRIDPCMRITENLVWDSAARPTIVAGAVEIRDPASACLLAAAWADAADADAMLVAGDGSPKGQALYAALTGALSAQGVRPLLLGQTIRPVLRCAQKFCGAKAAMHGGALGVQLLTAEGLLPPRALQRKVETLLARQDYTRPFSQTTQPPEEMPDAQALYIGSLAALAPQKALADAPLHAAVFAPSQGQAALAARVLEAAGVHGRVAVGQPDLQLWETGFILDASGEHVTVLDHQGAPDAAHQALLGFAAMENETEWIVRMDAPAAVETLAQARGARVTRVSLSKETWVEALHRAGDAQFRMQFDGLYRMLRILSALAERRTTLRGFLASLPQVYRHTERIPYALAGRGRLLREIAESEEGAKLDGGLRLSREIGTLTIDPDEQEAELLVIGEGATIEAAQELCGEIMDRIRGMSIKS
ncbi:MAG: NTP transferase domain-containing protein [Oscillospiraceae bacterium]|jgi:mannose-1-phosphate guanylyltransferase/phosphomannomutase|nr:NTP transferase domain-containing protein [Oscillospiraceae bacterium]